MTLEITKGEVACILRGLQGEGVAKAPVHKHAQRAPTAYEASTDFALVGQELADADKAAMVAIRDEIVRVRDLFLTRVARTVEARDVADVRNLALPNMVGVEKAVGAFLERTLDAGRGSARRELGGAVRKHVVELPNVKPASAMRYLKTKRFWITGVIGDNLLRDARGILLSAIETGEVMRDTMRKLKEAFVPYVGDDEVLRDEEPLQPTRLETIVRTNATDAYNRGRLVEFRENAEVVSFVEYSAILDDRTTEICTLLDGRVFRLDDPELDRFKPPNHYNCRSVLVPIAIGLPVSEDDMVTEAELGEARDLVGRGFGGEA